MGRFGSLGAVALLTALAASGCTSSDGGGASTGLEVRKTGLVAFETCDDLLAYFQTEAKADAELGLSYDYMGGAPRGIAVPALDAANSGAGEAAGAPTGADNQGGGGLGGVSGTNTQEKDVDEGDLVKTDGLHLYTVRNGHLLIYAAETLVLESDTPVDGGANALLLSGNQLVVLGTSYGNKVVDGQAVGEPDTYQAFSTIRVFDVADRTAPRVLRTLVADGELVASRLTGRLARLVVHHQPQLAIALPGIPGGVGVAEPGTAGGSEPTETPPVPAADADAGAMVPADQPADQPVDAGMAEPVEVRDVDVDAGVGPTQDDYLSAINAAIDATRLEDWVPQIVDISADGAVSTRQAAGCGQYFRPGERSGLGTTVVLSLDLDQPTETLADPAVVTATSIVYASGANLYLSTVNWRDFLAPMMAVAEGGPDVAVANEGGASAGSTGSAGASETPAAAPAPATDSAQGSLEVEDADAPDDRESTQIHRLSLPAAGGPARYEASGRVHGQPLNQFSFSEFDGHLRVATTEHNGIWGGGGGVGVATGGTVGTTEAVPPAETQAAPAMAERAQAQEVAEARSVTRVTIFDQALDAVGQTPALAPNEEIFAVRFLDERGYVVTYEQRDPLFTLDLSDPAAPAVVGQLDLLGYSAYLHPVDADHLLGIGYDGTDNGATSELQISLFDVADLANPTRADAVGLGEGYSDALYDHHALTFFDGLLLLPVNAWAEGTVLDGLEVFGVDVETGIEPKGHIDHSALTGQAGYAHVDRSVLIGETIYSFSNAGLVASNKADLSEIGHVLFPAGDGGGAVPGGGTMVDGQDAPPPAEPAAR